MLILIENIPLCLKYIKNKLHKIKYVLRLTQLYVLL